MSDFMRSIKITDLTNKANNWSAAEIEKFHGNKIPANRAIVCYKEGSGYVNASLTGAEYIEISTGAAYSVRHTVDENGWNCFSALHTKSTELNTFRIETPTYRSVTGTKEYREISSPNGEFGSSVLTKLNENELTSDLKIYERILRLVRKKPNIRLWGVTNAFAKASFAANLFEK